ncbi:hypothetical protein [Streptomonospora litoralis]|uniref:hypothetical protein n=1 Tax=Streptomonospora litoralis TaxID=2498135 RepID=UPI001035965F|nr:hypothetical protein [Streptomonospora litoralis]
MSLRQLRVLIDALPPTSALGRALNGNAWSDETHLLAFIADALQVSNAQVAAAAGAKSVKKPKPLPRPETAEHSRDEDPNAEAREAHKALVAQVMPGR